MLGHNLNAKEIEKYNEMLASEQRQLDACKRQLDELTASAELKFTQYRAAVELHRTHVEHLTSGQTRVRAYTEVERQRERQEESRRSRSAPVPLITPPPPKKKKCTIL
jgi:hypothetical protein